MSLEYQKRRKLLNTQPGIRPGTNAVASRCEETLQLVKYRVIWQQSVESELCELQFGKELRNQICNL